MSVADGGIEGALGKEGSIKVPLDSQDSKIDFITSAAPDRRVDHRLIKVAIIFPNVARFDSLVLSP